MNEQNENQFINAGGARLTPEAVKEIMFLQFSCYGPEKCTAENLNDAINGYVEAITRNVYFLIGASFDLEESVYSDILSVMDSLRSYRELLLTLKAPENGK